MHPRTMISILITLAALAISWPARAIYETPSDSGPDIPSAAKPGDPRVPQPPRVHPPRDGHDGNPKPDKPRNNCPNRCTGGGGR